MTSQYDDIYIFMTFIYYITSIAVVSQPVACDQKWPARPQKVALDLLKEFKNICAKTAKLFHFKFKTLVESFEFNLKLNVKNHFVAPCPPKTKKWPWNKKKGWEPLFYSLIVSLKAVECWNIHSPPNKIINAKS